MSISIFTEASQNKQGTSVAYVIINITWLNEEVMKEYDSKISTIMKSYGGKLLVRDKNPEIYEGDWKLNMVIVIEFESKKAVEIFYNSEEYMSLKKMRFESSYAM